MANNVENYNVLYCIDHIYLLQTLLNIDIFLYLSHIDRKLSLLDDNDNIDILYKNGVTKFQKNNFRKLLLLSVLDIRIFLYLDRKYVLVFHKENIWYIL